MPAIILRCVRWYCRYSLSYRDVEELAQERGLGVDHSTVYRWVQAYAPSSISVVAVICTQAVALGEWMKST
ncbi:Mobile element protein [uncultured Synechococcales cyanobacterium]|uniref:Mobile element protein n=1 Tax=uncultured Synechococcales cyanobacterium TaxID=1936017 RepID=A0A6J4VNN5_9CYAN|nr:Mobile element protein [uncultured Synechococcales cyanobacterium]